MAEKTKSNSVRKLTETAIMLALAVGNGVWVQV